MTKYILHGGFERKDNELNRSFYQELASDLPENATVLLVYFASEYDEHEEAYKEQVQRIINKSINFELATEKDFLEQVRRTDAVHFRGGHTPKLLAHLHKYPELKSLLTQKMVVSGSSAGAYALAKYGPGHSKEGIREGVGLVPVRVVCHYKSETMPPNPESYAELVNMAPELELVHLRDYEWRVFN
jgi:peptidase E